LSVIRDTSIKLFVGFCGIGILYSAQGVITILMCGVGGGGQGLAKKERTSLFREVWP